MTRAGMTGLVLTIGDVAGVIAGLEDSQWAAPSAAEGWSVKDVVTHMGDLLSILLEPSLRPSVDPPLGIEATNEVLVAEKRDWSPDQVREHYEMWGGKALERFRALQLSEVGMTERPFLDLGSYQVHYLADLCAFDHYTHLRHDILEPRGPLKLTVVPPDEKRLQPAVGWLLAGMPKMQRDIADALEGPIELTLTGPAGGTWLINRGQDGLAVTPTQDSTAQAVATVKSTTHDFTSWATTRSPWRQHAVISGAEEIVARFFDHLDLI
jgi:hypothetical protein